MAPRIELRGKEAVEKLFKRMADRCNNLGHVWGTIGEYMVRRTIRERFEKEQDPNGNRWVRWSKSYREEMNARGKGGNRILTDTGELRRSIVYRSTSNGVEFGTNKAYGRMHQHGARKGEYGTVDKKIKFPGGTETTIKEPNPLGRVPARPFLGINEEERGEIKQRLLFFLTGQRRRK
jgi:phage virion morphogenesis protein